MKIPSFAVLLLVITSLVPAVTQARPNNNGSEAYRHAQSMQSLSNGMLREFREKFGRHHRANPEESRFLQSLSSLENQCDQLLVDVRKRDDRDCIERTFNGIERTFHGARRKAEEMPVGYSLRGMMASFDRSLHAFEDTEVFGHHHHHGDRGREVSAQPSPSTPPRPGSLLQSLFQKLQRR